MYLIFNHSSAVRYNIIWGLIHYATVKRQQDSQRLFCQMFLVGLFHYFSFDPRTLGDINYFLNGKILPSHLLMSRQLTVEFHLTCIEFMQRYFKDQLTSGKEVVICSYVTFLFFVTTLIYMFKAMKKDISQLSNSDTSFLMSDAFLLLVTTAVEQRQAVMNYTRVRQTLTHSVM